MQEFGLYHLDAARLLAYFPTCAIWRGFAAFTIAAARAEPGCAVKAAAEAGDVRAERLAFLQRITDELMR